MPIDKKDVIDIAHLEKDNTVVLTISDHLEWDLANEHLLILQDKINAYLNAIESGYLNEIYPKAANKDVCIRVIAKYPPNSDGIEFIEGAKAIIESAGYKFEFEVYAKDAEI